MSQNMNKENKMGTMPVDKLLLSMSLPMMLSMLVQALYNIVDSIFVSRICEDALTAVSLAFPIQSLMIAFGAGVGVGINALLSRSLGAKDYKTVNKSATNGLFLIALVYVFYAVIGSLITRPFYSFQTDNPVIAGYGVDYLSIICVCSFGLFAQITFERLLQSTGKTFYSMITQATGAIINMIMDPILIFGLFGAPRLEAKGAALATIFGQCVAVVLAIYFNIKVNKEIDMSFKGFRPDGYTIVQIIRVGVPSTIMQAIGSLMVFCMNKILLGFTSTAAAVFGVYFKLQSFVFMPIFGLNGGMIPIIAYNYGAEKRKRLVKTINLSFVYALIIMSAGTLIFELIPDTLFSMFDASQDMLSMGRVALRIIAIHFPIAGFCIICGGAFQAMGNGVYSMINSIMRQIVVLIPVSYLLSLTGNVNNVWWAFPIAEIMSAAVTVYFMVRLNRRVISHIPDGEL